MDLSDINRVRRSLANNLSADAQYYRDELTRVASFVAQVERENRALTKNNEWLVTKLNEAKARIRALGGLVE